MKISPDVLRPHPLLALLPYRTLKRLAAESAVAEYPKGTVLFRQGERCDALYLIITGRCEARGSGRRGASVVQGTFGPGDILGERAFLHAEPHQYTATVVTECALVRIAADELDQLFARDKRLAARFSQLLAKRWSLLQNWASGSSRVRRVVSVLGLDPQIPARSMGERVAGAVSAITSSQVLLIRLERDTNSKRVHDWALREPRLEGEFGFQRQISKGSGKFDELPLPVGDAEPYAAAIAPLISHCSRHYDYVILQGDSDLPAACFSETVLQTDVAYVMIQPTDRHLYETEMLLASLADRSASAVRHVRPVVIGNDPTGLVNAAEAFERLGRRAHFFPMALPSSESGSGADSRVTMYVNRLAREIARCRIGLALSSGGAKGLAHVGVIQVLEEHGIEVDAVAGASMGAYVGSLWALGLDGKALEAIAREHEGRWGLRSVIDPVFPPRLGFIRTRKLNVRLRRHLDSLHFVQMARPLRVVATRLGSMERVVFSRGEVASAVDASIAIPGICVPVQIGNDTLVDGGVVDPLPVDVLEEMGIERIIAVNSIPTAEQLATWLKNQAEAPVPGASRWAVGRFLNKHLNYFASGNVFDIMIQAFVGAQMLVAETATHRADLVLRPVACDGWWHDFTHPGRYIELGRRVAEEALPEILALTKPTPAPTNEPAPLRKKSVAFTPALHAA